MRVYTRIVAILFILTCTAAPLYAQTFLRNTAVDSSFRIEYLIGRQTLGREFLDSSYGHTNINPDPPPYAWVGRHPDQLDRLRIDFGPSLPILEGMVEVTPFRSMSGRLVGSMSVLEAASWFNLVSGPAPSGIFWLPPTVNPPPTISSAELTNVIKPTFRSWEAAGLYHLSNEGGYRYSIVAGYRQESWTYRVDGNQDNNSYLRDEFVSQSPFLGLQTAMFFPWWKARFEVLGSPFMTKKISHTARDSGYYQQLDGTWKNGGFIEFQTEGTVNVTPSTWLGLFVRYTYEELRGEAKGTRTSPFTGVHEPSSYDFYTLKSMATIGFNFSYVF